MVSNSIVHLLLKMKTESGSHALSLVIMEGMFKQMITVIRYGKELIRNRFLF